MLFALSEQMMNGTVTLSVVVSAVEADTFPKAIAKIKAQPGFTGAQVVQEDHSVFSYSIKGSFSVYGRMTEEPLKIIS
jgi:hypothetical protein